MTQPTNNASSISEDVMSINKPFINAGDMSPDELRDWLNQMANSANSMEAFNCSYLESELRS